MTLADRKTPQTDIGSDFNACMHRDYCRQLKRERDAAVEELRNIANTNISLWEKDMRDQFQPWAKNRARDTLRAIEEGGK